MKKIILISGKAENGKTATAKILKRRLKILNNRVIIIPFAKYLKQILKDYYNWDGITKDEWFRSMAQQIGTDKIREELKMPLFHCQRVCDDIKVIYDVYDYILIDDCRFKNEAFHCLETFPNDTMAIRVERLNYKSSLTDKQLKHISETDMDDFKFYDFTIESESGLNNLEKQIDLILPNIINKNNADVKEELEDLEVGDKVKIIDILDKDKASHLLDFKGKDGFVFSWIIVGKEKRYKVLFDENGNNTAYFRRNELQKVKEGDM